MGSLKDELVKKGVLDDKRARQLAHEERARRNRIGQDAVAGEKQHAEQERRAREEARRAADREREARRQQEQARHEGQSRLAQVVRDHALTQGVRGPRRFHFVARDGKIPFLDVSDEIGRKLEAGGAAICEVPGSAPAQFVVLPGETARKVREDGPEYVLFLNDPRAADTHPS
ncbi:MAG: DUF2058 family protein [Acidobacteria bacterium]|nr:DUF2058 family protein [Acidobacteriota bacterium]